MKEKIICVAVVAACVCGANADFHEWAATPPMGWNSWDCYGAAVNEAEFKANVDVLAERLKPFGYEYAVCDIRWTVQNEGLKGYNQENPVYTLDAWGRYVPAPNRFPSARSRRTARHY